MPSKFDYLTYAAVATGVAVAWLTEHRDIHCPTFSSPSEECKEHGGMSFSYTKPKPGDSAQTLLDKISKAAGAETNAIKWRKSLLLSIAIIAVIWALALGRWPKSRELIIAILASFVVVSGFNVYYSYHIYGTAETWIKDSVAQLKTKI
jgi:hypothetical protein